MISKRKRALLLCSLFLILALVFSSCGSAPISKDKASNEQSTSVEMQQEAGIGFNNQAPRDNKVDKAKDTGQTSTNLDNRKIIKSSRVELETLEFDKTTNAIIEKTKSIGGYVESSNISGNRIRENQSFQNRYASFSLRVPEEFFEQFMLDFNNMGNVINSENSGTDITGEYFDSEARLKSLQVQEERLIEILKKAGSVKDIIELERELSSVRYEIESLTGTLRKWDNMVKFATIEVSVYEVQEIKEAKPTSLMDRIADGFSNSIKVLIKLVKELIILIAILLPFAIIALVIFLIAKYILKKIKKNDK